MGALAKLWEIPTVDTRPRTPCRGLFYTGLPLPCGVPYISAGDVAERRLRADPTHSNQKIAKEEGIDEQTVRAKRAELVATSGIPDVAKTLGLDGKWRKAKQNRKPKPERMTKEQRSAVGGDYLDGRKTQKELAEELGGTVQDIKISSVWAAPSIHKLMP